MQDSIDFHPYFEMSGDLPVRKRDCTLWIDDDTAAALSSTEALTAALAGAPQDRSALFVTSFHPGKPEGNSTLTRQWLRHLRAAGYRIHLLYYALDKASATPEIIAENRVDYDLFTEIAVETQLVGVNRNGLNVHVDDWCGAELLDAANDLTSR